MYVCMYVCVVVVVVVVVCMTCERYGCDTSMGCVMDANERVGQL